MTGVPENIINYVATQANIQDLTIISNDGGRDNFGLGKLYANGQISRHHASYIGKGKAMEQAYLTGKTELHLTPQGTVRFSTTASAITYLSYKMNSWPKRFVAAVQEFPLSSLPLA